MILTYSECVEIIKNNLSVDIETEKLRQDSDMLFALVKGDDFADKLIDKIDQIEHTKKAKARQKYARDVQDTFKRIFQPLENIWYATGGNRYYPIDDQETKTKFLKTIASIKDSNTLQHWIQTIGIELSHVDPNGLIFLEYSTRPRTEAYPTYKPLRMIRRYEHRGQLIEWVLFEPKKVERENGIIVHEWRIVDDKTDRIITQLGDDTFELDENKTFEHPFGQTPGIINSNIVKINDDSVRLSPVGIILGLMEEYARDQSIKTIYKFLQGFPIHWRYVTECEECKGAMKIDGKNCTSCDGRGYKQKGDVTDMVTLPQPTTDQPVIAPNIAGHISPDIETWRMYNEELEELERLAIITFWGTPLNSIETFGTRKTTTEVLFNKQPIENTLNRYADYMEFVEWKLSEWLLNFVDTSKKKDDQKIKITYGRNYVIEPSDTILKRYEEAKTKGDSEVILDELFRQYLQSEYRTNPVDYERAVKKALVEPHLHLSISEVNNLFGNEQAQRKALFGKWWDTLMKDDWMRGVQELEQMYDIWFQDNMFDVEQEPVDE